MKIPVSKATQRAIARNIHRQEKEEQMTERREGHSKLVYNKATRTIDTVITRPETSAPETIEVGGVWYDRRDTVDALTALLAEARTKIETYQGVIREYRQRDLAANPTPPPGVSLPNGERPGEVK